MIEVTDSQPVPYIKTADVLSTFGLRENGAQIAVISGTFSMLRPDGTELVPATAIAVVADDATFSVLIASWDTLAVADPFGKNYIEVWKLDTATFTGQVFTRPAQVGLQIPASPLTDLDLERMHSGILAEAPDGTDANIPADPTWAGKREQTWRRLGVRLQQGIVDSTAINSWYSFLDYLAYDCLWMICWDLATEERGDGKWTLKAIEYSELRETEWLRILFDVDRDRNNVPDGDGPSQVSAVGHGGYPSKGRRW